MNLGWYRSYIQPAHMGMNRPRSWLGSSATVTQIGDMPNPSSTRMGTSVMVPSIEE